MAKQDKGKTGPKSKTRDVVLEFRTVQCDVCIVGESELIMHQWSEKAKQMMLDKQMGKPVEKKPKKDPEADYRAAMYQDEEGHPAMPAPAFKAAIVSGCRMMEGVTMTAVKQAVRVDGELVRIYGKPYMREDMVRLETGVADIRHRPGFKRWKAKLSLTFVGNMLTQDQLINLVNAGGFGGVGEWRPSAPKSQTGTHGCFKVVTEQEWKKYVV